MAEEMTLNKPWLVAVWPGMGHVAVSGGYYLMAKLGMHLMAEMTALELFDIEHVDVKDGIIRPGRLPRSRFFVWKDPEGKRDLVVFIGEAQPPLGKQAFCRRLTEFARHLGVERVVTFAAMATGMTPEDPSRVFCAATDESGLEEMKQAGLEVLEDGRIGGLNGVLLSVAAEAGLPGMCLLGEMPQMFVQLPYPKAAMAVLTAFQKLSGVTVDLTEMAEQANEMDRQLTALLTRMQEGEEGVEEPEVEESEFGESVGDEAPTAADRRRIEGLFEKATKERSVAYELKRELDRLGMYPEYEDRFLDLFKRP